MDSPDDTRRLRARPAGEEPTRLVDPEPAGSEPTRLVDPEPPGSQSTRILEPDSATGAPLSAPTATEPELAVGSEFAGYLIDQELARSEMAIVYRVRNTRLERTEALKVIAPHYAADADFRARFRREAMNAAIIENPHIVRVFDVNEHVGRLYIAMQFVDGIDLRHKLARDGALAPTTAVEITTQVAAALDAAHANGVIHRDVKPGNILIAAEQKETYAYLSDFGVSRRVTAQSDLTRPGSTVGTAAYTAPEQQLGEPADHRSDVYSLGCVLFEMVTGHKPFEGKTGTAVAMAHVNEPVPSAVALEQRLPATLDRVLARAMAKDPDARFQSAGGLAAAALGAVENKDEIDNSADTRVWNPEPATLPHRAVPSRGGDQTLIATPKRSDHVGTLPSRSARILIGQIIAITGCLTVFALARWGHSYVDWGHGMESLWNATRTGGDSSSPLRAVDFWTLTGLVAIAFGLIVLSFGVLRRTLTIAATIAGVLVIAQLVRLWRGLGPNWHASHTMGTGFWASVAAAVLIALGAAISASAPVVTPARSAGLAPQT